jgi:superfamily I DNA/RNA helicase
MGYAEAQTAAIAVRGSALQIIACAGSSKTQVISARIACLLANGEATPVEVVAFTFAEKAAAELKDCNLSEVEEATRLACRTRRDVRRHDACIRARPTPDPRA